MACQKLKKVLYPEAIVHKKSKVTLVKTGQFPSRKAYFLGALK